MSELMRALAALRVSFKPTGPVNLLCQLRQIVRFEMEITRSDAGGGPELGLVARRVGGDARTFVDLAPRLLAQVAEGVMTVAAAAAGTAGDSGGSSSAR